MDDKNILNIKLINHLTGEITEVEIDSANKAKDLYLELRASAAVIKKAMAQLATYLGDWLGDDESQPFADGHLVKWTQRQQLIYRADFVKEFFKEHLDKDTFAAAWEAILKLDQTAVDAMVKEMMERNELPGNSLKQIREQADIKATKPYIEVK